MKKLITALPAPAMFIVSGLSMYLGAAIAVDLFNDATSTSVAWSRSVVAAIVLLLWRRPWQQRWTGATFASSALFGTILVAMNMLFYEAIERIPLGAAVSLEYLGLIVVAVVAGHGWRARVAAVLAIGGVASISGWGLNISDDVALAGVAFALAAGGAWAMYAVLGRRIASRRSGLDSLAVAMPVGVVLLSPLALMGRGATPGVSGLLQWDLVGIVIAVGLLSSLVPYAIEQVVLTKMSAPTFSLLTALMPATSLVVGLIFLRQVPTAGELTGLIVISLAVVLATAAERRAQRVAAP